MGHLALPDVVVVDVGDLELAPARGDQVADDVEHAGLVAVDAGDAVLGGRVLGLLLDVRHPPVVSEDRARRGGAGARAPSTVDKQDAGADGIGPEGVDHRA